MKNKKLSQYLPALVWVIASLLPASASASLLQGFEVEITTDDGVVGSMKAVLEFSEGPDGNITLTAFEATIVTDWLVDAVYNYTIDDASFDLTLDKGTWLVDGFMGFSAVYPDPANACVSMHGSNTCRLGTPNHLSFTQGVVSGVLLEDLLFNTSFRENRFLTVEAELAHVPVPAPGALPLFTAALAGLGWFNRRRKIGQALPA